MVLKYCHVRNGEVSINSVLSGRIVGDWNLQRNRKRVPPIIRASGAKNMESFLCEDFDNYYGVVN